MSTRAHGITDPDDPRAPTLEAWERLTSEERKAVVEALPAQVPEALSPPEGDDHREVKTRLLDDLGEYFRRMGRRVYLSSEINVYYPDEPRFAPDFLAVLDVDPHKRSKWVVTDEGKGLDLVIEITVTSRAKDLGTNVERYARLGIPEYFVFERTPPRLHGFRLSAPQTYERLLPQGGKFTTAVLGLELGLEGERLRFYAANATLLGTGELLARATHLIDDMTTRHDAELATLRAELDRLKR